MYAIRSYYVVGQDDVGHLGLELDRLQQLDGPRRVLGDVRPGVGIQRARLVEDYCRRVYREEYRGTQWRT